MGKRRKPSPKHQTGVAVLERGGWKVIERKHRRGNAKGTLLQRGDELKFVSWSGVVSRIT